MSRPLAYGVIADDEARTRRVRRLARVRAALRAHRYRAVRTFCLFVGYARSGSSLAGSLLDAHRHSLIAQELDALGFVGDGWERGELFALIELNAERFTREGREWTGYSYDVPGQWQGRVRELRVIGDKKAGRSTRRLIERPELLPQLRERVQVPLRFVHVVRNPYDNIATRQRRGAQRRTLRESIELYFRLARAVDVVRDRIGAHAMLDVRHEDLVARPRAELARMCDFLGLDAPEAYLEDAAEVVHPSPNRTRARAGWTKPLIRDVRARCADHPALAGYSYSD